ncbi:acyltransferase family protein [bacterium]|nr:acyltransferase family protein [bacterium]
MYVFDVIEPVITSPRPLEHLPYLDGVRALAIVLVLVWHYFTGIVDPELLGGLTGVLQKLTGQTWAGVDVFFVLSGFLIGRILIHNKSSERYFTTFYIRRAFPYLSPVSVGDRRFHRCVGNTRCPLDKLAAR